MRLLTIRVTNRSISVEAHPCFRWWVGRVGGAGVGGGVWVANADGVEYGLARMEWRINMDG